MTAEDIIMKIEAEKVKAGEEDDKRVACSKTSLFSWFFFIDPAFEAEATLADLCLRVFHRGQKPCDLLLGNHLHLLGHPRPVHTRRG